MNKSVSRQVTGSQLLDQASAWPEDARLLALQNLRILDTPPEPAFNRIVNVARQLFGVPIVAVSLVDRDRQWFKASCGLDVPETERSVSFCAHSIVSPRRVFCVPDATKDPLFRDNRLVTGAPHVRFYAGAPVRSPEGAPVGALCIIDFKPRPPLRPQEEELLVDLAGLVNDELALRANTRLLETQISALNEMKAQLELSNAALHRLNERHRRNMELAVGIQQSNLPPALERIGELQAAGLYVPSQSLSGDMYGYGRLGERHGCFWIADTMGHGVKAALHAITLCHLVGSEVMNADIQGAPSMPDDVLRRINRAMLKPGDDVDSYSTMAYGLYEDGSDHLTLALAGHPGPLVLLPKREPQRIEGSGGVPLALFRKVVHDNLTIDFPVGSRLLLHSDGLVDSVNDEGIAYGEERLADWLDLSRDEPLGEAMRSLRSEIGAWTGRRAPADDIAAVIVERLGPR